MSEQSALDVIPYADRNAFPLVLNDGVRIQKTDTGYIIETLGPDLVWRNSSSYKEVVLNNDQILAFGASQGPPIDENAFIPIIPATWVAADGGFPTEMFIITSISIFLYQTDDGAYSSDPEVAFCYGGNGGSQINQGVNLVFDQGLSSFVFGLIPQDPPRIDEPDLLIDNGIWFENLDLTGSFTGGNAANTLTIRVYYNTVPLT